MGIKNKQTECFKNYGVVHRNWQIQAGELTVMFRSFNHRCLRRCVAPKILILCFSRTVIGFDFISMTSKATMGHVQWEPRPRLLYDPLLRT